MAQASSLWPLTLPTRTIKPKEEKRRLALRIRLARFGAKKRPYYRIVVTNSESPRDGRFLEIMGTYDPSQDPAGGHSERELLALWWAGGPRLRIPWPAS